MLVPKVNVVLQADKDIGSITEADIWLNCMDGNGNFLSVAAEDHTGDGHYIATLPGSLPIGWCDDNRHRW